MFGNSGHHSVVEDNIVHRFGMAKSYVGNDYLDSRMQWAVFDTSGPTGFKYLI